MVIKTGDDGSQCEGFSLQLQLIGNEGDKLGIGGLAFGVGDGVAEEFLQRLQIAAVPRQLDGVPDGALDARGRRGKRLRDLRVENFCDGVDYVHIVNCDQNRLAQILIALDVRRNADFVDDRSYQRFDLRLLPEGLFLRALCRDDFQHALGNRLQITRLADKVPHAELFCRLRGVVGQKARQYQTQRRLRKRACLFQNGNAVQLRQQQVHDQHVRLLAM